MWTPDGANIAFELRYSADRGLYCVRADGSGEPYRLTDEKAALHPQSFSPDGRWLAYLREGASGQSAEIWTAPVEGDRDHLRLGAPQLFLSAPVYLAQAAFSPDGQWLAYTSPESGRQEVYVRPFPRTVGARTGRSQISTAGGLFPSWGRAAPGTARKLYFLGLDGRIMVADYTANRDFFTATKPQVWSGKAVARTLGFYDYAMTADGKRSAVVLYPGEAAEPPHRWTDSVTVLLNFFDELRRRVPAGGR